MSLSHACVHLLCPVFPETHKLSQAAFMEVKAISLMKQWALRFTSQLLLCTDMPSAVLGGQIMEINGVCVRERA